MKFDERSIKIWSTIGQRATVGMAALELVKEINDLIIITCDVSTSAGLDRFRKTYPEQFIDVGIAEQNMIGIAAGLANENFKVLTTTFAPFQTMRCLEQIKVNLGYMKQNVCMIGIASGLSLGALGYTHCCIEDIGAIRSIPGITIISPSDAFETVKAMEASLKSTNPTYIRLTGTSNNPIVNKVDYNFEIGKSIKLKDGLDVTIFSCGSMVHESLEVARKLEEKKISTAVINMHTIKPIDKSAIIEAKDSKLIVTIEEHNIIGGLGSAIAEVKSTIRNYPKQIFFGVDDKYSKGGSYSFLKENYRLSADKIVNDIENQLIHE